MKITKHMQSCFLLETGNCNILIDPGSYVFNEEGLAADDFKDIDLIIITHEHADHFDLENISKIIKRDDPVFLGTTAAVKIIKANFPSIESYVISEGFERKFNNVEIEGFISTHGPLPSGKPAPIVSGAIIDDGELKFYTPGDSTELNKNAKADIIATPICGQVVMNIDQAKAQLQEFKPKIAIPIHYDNPNYPVNPDDFVTAMQNTNIEVIKLSPGESRIFNI